ncbi:protein trichome birefringence-like 3 isoform X1 [Juglans microcarpa x Juglans regia]|uniref:protein trichome birefringence-like 3 isoform X1 n=1 Tax=Juglans microcarpa x Juglans regia TaxID=2249226 RepID=UPI001B7E7DFA|nr:protein trichome birefringence-like 3 isoform X1 [Juglans microcarpa x Juglans regia]
MSLPASTSSGTMKPSRGRPPLPVIIIIVCVVAFMALFYTETSTFLSHSSIFRLKTCTRKNSVRKSSKYDRAAEINHDMDNSIVDDRFEFDPEECNVASGKWVFNSSIKPLYSDMSCPYLDIQVSCVKNGRPDSDYRHWEWQPEDCTLPRFNPEVALKKLRGKRLLFVGDSLQRGQWQSFVCMVESIIPEDQKFLRRGRSHTVFKAKEYNASIEFYWAPFLVESNSDIHIIADPKKRILKVDSVSKHAENWLGVDMLVFNTYVWWMSGTRLKTLWGSFANGEEGFEELDTPVAYKIGLKTWANWVDSTINPNKTRVFFTTMSPTHTRSEDWNSTGGLLKCFNDTKPVMKKKHWGSGSDKRMMSVVASVVRKMKVPVTVINITQISEYRVDAHTSVYTETGGKVLTDEQKADPLHHADCIHWCLPGVPDTWNQIFLAHL